MTSRRVIITGGSGFVGTNLVECFSQQGWEIRNFDIAEPCHPGHRDYWSRVNILDRERLIDETRDFQPNVFLHFAARTDLNEKTNLGGYAANIEGVCNVVEAIQSTRSVQRAVFASSQLVCELGYRPQDENDCRPSTLYGQSKVLTERTIRTAEDMGAAWTILRPTSLWGPWFDVPYKNFFTAIARNYYVHPGEVRTLKQWGFIGNSVYQVQRIIEAPVEQVHRKTFYLADYEPVELRDFADKVQAALGAKPVRTVPVNLLKTAAILGDLGKKLGWSNAPLTSFRYNNITMEETQDLEPLREITGGLPYSIEQGIGMTVRWLLEHDKTIQIK
jgi:nucleoside-diphosphate-sugar epimerase